MLLMWDVHLQNVFDIHDFKRKVINTILVQNILSKDFGVLITIVQEVLNKHVPCKTKSLRAGHSNFVTNTFLKFLLRIN